MNKRPLSSLLFCESFSVFILIFGVLVKIDDNNIDDKNSVSEVSRRLARERFFRVSKTTKQTHSK